MKSIADHILRGMVSAAEAMLSKTKDKRWVPPHPANKHVSELRNVSIAQTEIARKCMNLIKTWKQAENWHYVKKHLVRDSA